MLQPLVRRTWAPRGHTPVQRQWHRHDRLSAISAVSVSPRRRRLGLYWSMQRCNVHGDNVAAFLQRVRRQVRRKIVLIWDRWSVHKAGVVGRYLERHRRSVVVEWLPAYAPELNPAEQVWNHAKYTDLANLAPDDLEELESHVEESFGGQRARAHLLRAFFRKAQLAL